MAKPAQENPVSLPNSVPRWAKVLETIADKIGEVSEGLSEASPRHLSVVVPMEIQGLIQLRDSLSAVITEMHAAALTTAEGGGP